MGAKRIFSMLSKLLLILVIIGFFMPVCCSLTGPDLIKHDDTAFYGWMLVVAVVLSVASLVMIKSDNTILPLVVGILVIAVLLIAQTKLRNNIGFGGILDYLDTGGYMIFFSSIAAMICSIAAMVLKPGSK